MSAKFDETNKVWTTCNDPVLYNPHVSIAHILLRSLELFGSKIAQVSVFHLKTEPKNRFS